MDKTTRIMKIEEVNRHRTAHDRRRRSMSFTKDHQHEPATDDDWLMAMNQEAEHHQQEEA